MKSSFRSFAFLSVACAALPLVAFAQPVVWTTSSLVRTGKTDAAGTTSQAVISAARGEYESFQIAVQAPAGGLTNVNVTVSDLSGPGGATIAKSSFSLFREQYVYVSQSSPDWDGSNRPLGAGWYPDGLIPFTDPSTGQPITGANLQAVPFSLSAAVNQPIWVDLLVPRNAAPGLYTGNYTVTSNQGNFTGAITLTVWNFTLPLQSSMKSAFLYWTASSQAADQELLRNKIAPLHTDTSIQSGLMSQYGLSTVGLNYWSGADISTCSMSAAPSVSALKASAAQQQAGLSQLIYSADEIDSCPSLIPMVKQWGKNMHQAGIDNLITMAPNPLLFDDGSGTGRSAVDIWTVLPVGYDAAGANIGTALAKGDSVWSYNALVQDSYSPKWEIDFSPVNFRIQPGFISNSLGLTGLLYWRVDLWSSDPWNQVNNIGEFSAGNYAGEGMFVYPGADVGIQGVAPSIRLKWLRDGVEDYEYLQLLKAAGQSSFAQQKSAAVGASWSSWSQDPTVLLSVRDEIGNQLSVPVTSTSSSSSGSTGSTSTGSTSTGSTSTGSTSTGSTSTGSTSTGSTSTGSTSTGSTSTGSTSTGSTSTGSTSTGSTSTGSTSTGSTSTGSTSTGSTSTGSTSTGSTSTGSTSTGSTSTGSTSTGSTGSTSTGSTSTGSTSTGGTSTSTGSTSTAAPPAACGASSLTMNVTQPAAGITVHSGSLQPIRVQIADNCGSNVTASSGSSTVSFSNGDSQVTLQDQGGGIWAGSWVPNIAASPVTLTIRGTEGRITGSANVSLTVQANAPATHTPLRTRSEQLTLLPR